MIYYILLIAMVILVIAAIELKDLLYAIISLAGAAVVLTILFYMLKAPDIAITQGVTMAGLSTAIYVIALSRTKRREE